MPIAMAMNQRHAPGHPSGGDHGQHHERGDLEDCHDLHRRPDRRPGQAGDENVERRPNGHARNAGALLVDHDPDKHSVEKGDRHGSR